MRVWRVCEPCLRIKIATAALHFTWVIYLKKSALPNCHAPTTPCATFYCYFTLSPPCVPSYRYHRKGHKLASASQPTAKIRSRCMKAANNTNNNNRNNNSSRSDSKKCLPGKRVVRLPGGRGECVAGSRWQTDAGQLGAGTCTAATGRQVLHMPCKFLGASQCEAHSVSVCVCLCVFMCVCACEVACVCACEAACVALVDCLPEARQVQRRRIGARVTRQLRQRSTKDEDECAAKGE